MDGTIYGFEQPLADESRVVSLEEFRGQVVLVVNTASKCMFTKQYTQLQELYEAYGPRGFVVLAFPCNQFGKQEPGSGEEIVQFCSASYHITFPIFKKIDVNGKDTHPLFAFLKDALPGIGKKVKWNFTKFLVGRDGKPVARFAPSKKPAKLRREIERLLGDGARE